MGEIRFVIGYFPKKQKQKKKKKKKKKKVCVCLFCFVCSCGLFRLFLDWKEFGVFGGRREEGGLLGGR